MRSTTPPRPLSKDTVDVLRLTLRQLLDDIGAGRLDTTPTGRARIEGAVVALEVIAGADPAALAVELLGTDAAPD